MDFEANLASPEMELQMERDNVPEIDRDEVRRFSDFLRERKTPKTMRPEVKAWALPEMPREKE
mgnify:CR=1 FL=1